MRERERETEAEILLGTTVVTRPVLETERRQGTLPLYWSDKVIERSLP